MTTRFTCACVVRVRTNVRSWMNRLTGLRKLGSAAVGTLYTCHGPGEQQHCLELNSWVWESHEQVCAHRLQRDDVVNVRADQQARGRGRAQEALAHARMLKKQILLNIKKFATLNVHVGACSRCVDRWCAQARVTRGCYRTISHTTTQERVVKASPL